jgi:hypothetical protein
MSDWKAIDDRVGWTSAELICFTQPLSRFEARFGPPMKTGVATWFHDVDVWSLEFSCALQVVVHYAPEVDRFGVYANAPEIDHIMRHLGVEDAELLTRSDFFGLVPVLSFAWAVREEDGDGGVTELASAVSPRDAACLFETLPSKPNRRRWFEHRARR